MWQDVIINRVLTINEIEKGLCAIFPVVADEILIVEDITDTKVALSEDIRILCQTWFSKTEFPFSMSIYLMDKLLLPRGNKLEHDILKIGHFCEELNCEAIIGDDTGNPCSWVYIKSRTEYKTEYIDIEQYDCREPFEFELGVR